MTEKLKPALGRALDQAIIAFAWLMLVGGAAVAATFVAAFIVQQDWRTWPQALGVAMVAVAPLTGFLAMVRLGARGMALWGNLALALVVALAAGGSVLLQT